MRDSHNLNLDHLRRVSTADVYKQGRNAGTLRRLPGGEVEFRYREEYLNGGEPVSLSLPLTEAPLLVPNGGLPAFFAGLLPEGYRLTALVRHLKVSPSDELTLLLAVGTDTPGDVQVLPEGAAIEDAANTPTVNIRNDDGELDFSEVRTSLDLRGIPGVQDKVSAQMVTSPVSHSDMDAILKLNPKAYPGLVENEYAHLVAARTLGIPVAKARLIHDTHGEPGLLVKRFDRSGQDGQRAIRRHPAEDALQIMGLPPAQKYNVSTEEVIEVLAAQCDAAMIAKRNLFLQFLYAWLTGNGDLHGKNMSLLQTEGLWKVAPLYDLPSTFVYGDKTMALDINGKRRHLRWRDWQGLADNLGLPERSVARAVQIAKRAASQVNWASLPFEGSPLNATLRELRFRRAELPEV